MSLNRVTIAGRLARDLELRHTQSGMAVASFTLAVDGDYKDKQTDERPVYWIDCIAWASTAEFMSRYLNTKGRMAVVDGRLQTRAWTDKDGNKRKSVEVVADHVYFGDSKRDGDGGSYGGSSYGDRGNSYGGGSYGGSRPAPSAPPDYGIPSGGDQFSELADDDGDLPF